jgi:hypothetical protein
MHELLATREPATEDPAALVRHPHRIDLALQHRSARVRASSLSVFARALEIPVSSGLTTITRSTNGSRIRATSQQLAVTSNATRSVGNRLSASILKPSGVLGTRPAERTFPSSQIATTQKSRCTSRPIARPTHLTNAIAHLHNTVVDTDRRENQREKRHRPIRARTLNPGKSQGRPNDKHGLEAHRRKRPTRLRSPKKAPVPDHRTVGPDPDGPSEKHFHAAMGGASVAQFSAYGVGAVSARADRRR